MKALGCGAIRRVTLFHVLSNVYRSCVYGDVKLLV